MPVGPSYRVSCSPKRCADSGEYAAPDTGTGRVCGVSASSAPRITTVSTLSLSATASSSAQKVRQRIFGSTPCISTMSRAAHLIVVVRLIVDLDDRIGLPDRVQMLQGIAGRVTGVVPALERRHNDRVVQFR